MSMLEQRKLKADLVGFAQADDFRHPLDEMETELGAQLLQATGDAREVDYLLILLRLQLSGRLLIQGGQTVDVLAKASAGDGDIVLIVRSENGIFAHVLDSQTDSP